MQTRARAAAPRSRPLGAAKIKCIKSGRVKTAASMPTLRTIGGPLCQPTHTGANQTTPASGMSGVRGAAPRAYGNGKRAQRRGERCQSRGEPQLLPSLHQNSRHRLILACNRILVASVLATVHTGDSHDVPSDADS